MIQLIILVIIITAIIFWISEFSRLMKMKNEEFVSKDDKLIWALALIFLSVFGAILFFFIVPEDSATSTQSKINGKPKPITEESYKEVVTLFPKYEDYIRKALTLTYYERVNLEKHYRHMTDEKLLEDLNDKANTTDRAYGVLIFIMHRKKLLKP